MNEELHFIERLDNILLKPNQASNCGIKYLDNQDDRNRKMRINTGDK